MPRSLVLLATLAVLGAAAKLPDQHAESAEVASQIVQQLQALGNHKLPPHAARSAVALQALPSSLHYETAAPYYDPYSPEFYRPDPEPTADPNVTPSGLNVNGALGFISYLVLLVLLQSAVEGVAARAPTHRRKRRAAPGDLLGRALELSDWPELPATAARGDVRRLKL